MAKTNTNKTNTKEALVPQVTTKEKTSTSLITWGPGWAIVIVLAIYLVAQILAGFLISLYPLIRHWSVARSNNWLSNAITAEFWLTLSVEVFSLILLGLFLKYRKSNFKSIGVKDHPRFKDLGWVLVGFAIYFSIYIVAVEVLTTLIPSFNPNAKQALGFSTSISGSSLWLVFFSLVIFPPIVEEILFRGFLYSGLRNKFRKLTAALITSAIFASLHLIEGVSGLLWIAALDTFILSMTLIFLREKTDKLWASMGLHMLKNFVAFASLYLFHVS